VAKRSSVRHPSKARNRRPCHSRLAFRRRNLHTAVNIAVTDSGRQPRPPILFGSRSLENSSLPPHLRPCPTAAPARSRCIPSARDRRRHHGPNAKSQISWIMTRWLPCTLTFFPRIDRKPLTSRLSGGALTQFLVAASTFQLGLRPICAEAAVRARKIVRANSVFMAGSGLIEVVGSINPHISKPPFNLTWFHGALQSPVRSLIYRRRPSGIVFFMPTRYTTPDSPALDDCAVSEERQTQLTWSPGRLRGRSSCVCAARSACIRCSRLSGNGAGGASGGARRSGSRKYLRVERCLPLTTTSSHASCNGALRRIRTGKTTN